MRAAILVIGVFGAWIAAAQDLEAPPLAAYRVLAGSLWTFVARWVRAKKARSLFGL